MVVLLIDRLILDGIGVLAEAYRDWQTDGSASGYSTYFVYDRKHGADL
jgi:hypothetical protein